MTQLGLKRSDEEILDFECARNKDISYAHGKEVRATKDGYPKCCFEAVCRYPVSHFRLMLVSMSLFQPLAVLHILGAWKW